ncbi:MULTISPECIES: hypothetical protein [unclassified Pseudomonas]|uniref:hypothetical protein n=1 Tax=unclassified Pseudomonas TaxID=196821 RepID=UPI002AC8A516|nr:MULTISPECIES: hypothetical protein [unclassified Pseudomonas]MEB0048437.1 hypothetical protein [Pseudomonas sp. Dout3]MEB0098021.1 hypothetical protein [Pseudomonas sp. DC1.2]WPX57047.1 hypothetical protein RHM68_15475 [Pseudomonas sp. DC1.2]
MKAWPKIKSLALLLLVSLLLNALVRLYLRLTFILTPIDSSTSLGRDILLHQMQEVLGITLASALIPALLLLFNYRLTAYGALIIGFLLCLQLPQAVALGQLLTLFWILMVIIWLAWNKLRGLYHYYRAK